MTARQYVRRVGTGLPRLSRQLTRKHNGGQTTTETEFTVKPAYELNETDEAWGLTAQLPGVTKASW